MDSIITEGDLEKIISKGKPKAKKSVFLRVILSILSVFGCTLAVYVLINFQSLKTNFGFWYENEYSTNDNPDIAQKEIILPKQVTKETTVNLPEIADNSIFIPVLSLKAPITWNVINNADSVRVSLENGAIHIAETALPGEIGNTFVTGHSSNYPWAKGNFNNIFALINRLVAGDLIQIRYKGIDYIYKVADIKTVKPTDATVLAPTKNSVLTLMTCTPVGTSINRLIVISNQIFPDPSLNIKSDATGTQTLPNVR